MSNDRQGVEKKALDACFSAMEWWSEHEYDTASDGEEERNLYDDEPEFVTLAREALRMAGIVYEGDEHGDAQ